MKGFLIAILLGSGSLAATSSDVQDFTQETCTEMVQTFRGFRGDHKTLTEEQQELFNYAIDLKQSSNFEGMSEEQLMIAKEEIHSSISAKAEELGVELPKFAKNILHERPKMSDEMLQFKEFAKELKEKYEFDKMSDEEIAKVKEEISNLLKEKAAELGIENEFGSGQRGRKNHRYIY